MVRFSRWGQAATQLTSAIYSLQGQPCVQLPLLSCQPMQRLNPCCSPRPSACLQALQAAAGRGGVQAPPHHLRQVPPALRRRLVPGRRRPPDIPPGTVALRNCSCTAKARLGVTLEVAPQLGTSEEQALGLLRKLNTTVARGEFAFQTALLDYAHYAREQRSVRAEARSPSDAGTGRADLRGGGHLLRPGGRRARGAGGLLMRLLRLQSIATRRPL